MYIIPKIFFYRTRLYITANFNALILFCNNTNKTLTCIDMMQKYMYDNNCTFLMRVFIFKNESFLGNPFLYQRHLIIKSGTVT